MQAYPDTMRLLPGTFESLRDTGLLRPGNFDLVTLHHVSEHLPDNKLVIQGAFNVLRPGQSIHVRHHNYYGRNGHHRESSVGTNWAHLEPTSKAFNLPWLNRIRLGDLIAILDVFFSCARGRLETGVEKTVPLYRLIKLKKRGFN